MHITEDVRKKAIAAELSDQEIDRVIDDLLPLVREKFKGMQFPSIEVIKEHGEVKLMAYYIFQ